MLEQPIDAGRPAGAAVRPESLDLPPTISVSVDLGPLRSEGAAS